MEGSAPSVPFIVRGEGPDPAAIGPCLPAAIDDRLSGKVGTDRAVPSVGFFEWAVAPRAVGVRRPIKNDPFEMPGPVVFMTSDVLGFSVACNLL